MKKRIAIRLDAGKSIGLGHLMRCLALAQALKMSLDSDILFVCRIPLQLKMDFPVYYLPKEYLTSEDGYDFPPIDDELPDIVQLISERQIDCLVVDHYGATESYFKMLKEQVSCPVFCVDDSRGRQLDIDGVINGNLYGIDAYYPNIPVQLLGGQYTLLREDFWHVSKKEVCDKLKHIYITSGGSDPLGFCEKMIKELLEWNDALCYHIIVGADFEENYIDRLKNYPVDLVFHADMKLCMEKADVFVTSAGSTVYELAAMGTPSVSYVIAQDQNELGKTVWSMGGSLKGGFFEQYNRNHFFSLLDQLTDVEVRKKLSNQTQQLISLKGAFNTAKRIGAFLFHTQDEEQLREVKKEDCDLLYHWANDTETRKNAFSSEPIGYQEHCKWFRNKLDDTECKIFIFEMNGMFIGQVRVDGWEAGEIDYYISPCFRGQKKAQKMLELLEKQFKKEKEGMNHLNAKVKFENIPSQKVFERLGYRKEIKEAYIFYEKKLR